MDRSAKTFQRQVSKAKVRTPIRRVRLWTRLSPAHLLRVFVDSYVKGCVTFASDDEGNARSSGASHLRHAQGVASARELLNLCSDQGVQAPEEESVLAGSVHFTHKHRAIITGCHGPASADLQGSPSALRRSSPNGVDEVPWSKQEADINVCRGGLEALAQTSPLHSTEFLQSRSRLRAAFGDHRLGPLIPRGGSGRILRRQRSRSASSVTVSPVPISMKPLSPVTDMSTFREQPHRRKPSRSFTRPASTVAVRRPNPASRDYDNRAPPPTASAASPHPFLDAMSSPI